MGTLDMNKILILHGWTYTTDKWKNFTDILERLGFDIEILEIPGLTQKSKEIWDLEKYSKWLGDKVGNSKVMLIGHSNGGRIAAYFTSNHPEKVEKLVLMDSAGIYHKDLYIQIKKFVFGTVAKIGKKITGSEVLKKFLYRLAGESDYQKASPNMKQSMVNLISFDLVDCFKKITSDTLIIWGESDKVTPVSDGVVINKLIANSKLEIVNGAKHSPFFTNPDETAAIVSKFLE